MNNIVNSGCSIQISPKELANAIRVHADCLLRDAEALHTIAHYASHDTIKLQRERMAEVEARIMRANNILCCVIAELIK